MKNVYIKSKIPLFSIYDDAEASGYVDYIKLTFLDNDGIPYGGEKYPTEANLQEDEIRALKVKLPDNYGSYEIWITK